MIKNWIKNKFSIIKFKVIEYFLLKNSLDHLSNIIKKFYIWTIGFDDIYYENKNSKRLKMSILICIIFWLVGFYLLSIGVCDYIISLMAITLFSSGQLKQLMILCASITFTIAMFKIDWLFGELNYNLSPFKILYYLINDWKQKHELNDKNYKKLAILSRIIQTILIDFEAIIVVIVTHLFFIFLASLSSNSSFWMIFFILTIPIIIMIPPTINATICLYIIVFNYYKMIFDQINKQFHLICNTKSKLFHGRQRIIINKTKQRQLISLIDQHNQAAIQIEKINLIIRRSLASAFVNISIIKIISLYLSVQFNQFITKCLLAFIIIVTLTFSSGACYMFTLQIKSAHQPLKSIYSIVCKYKLNLRVKLKVN